MDPGIRNWNIDREHCIAFVDHGPTHSFGWPSVCLVTTGPDLGRGRPSAIAIAGGVPDGTFATAATFDD
jgi:hypothetical protein